MMNLKENPTVELAAGIALAAHAGQVDKAGAPYINHATRVAAAFRDPTLRAAAFLHDVVEDCGPAYSLANLARMGVPAAVLDLVDALTKRAGEHPEIYLSRVRQHEGAVWIKIADMADNLDMARLGEITARDRERMERYAQTLPRLIATAINMRLAVGPIR